MKDTEQSAANKMGIEEMRESLRTLRTDVAALQARVARLEVRDALLEAPGSAGDDPIPT